jgi:hypothetical protein
MQRQRPLDRAPLTIADKDADLQRASQSVGAALTSKQLIWRAHSDGVPPCSAAGQLRAGRMWVSAGGGLPNGPRRPLSESADGVAARRLDVAMCAPDELSRGKTSSD